MTKDNEISKTIYQVNFLILNTLIHPIRQAVTIILWDIQGRIAMHLRDNKLSIPFPNYWALFGGWMEAGETPEHAILREIREELQCDLDPNQLYKIKVIELDGLEEGLLSTNEVMRVHLFEYTVIYELQNAHLTEGQCFDFWTKSELNTLNIVPLHLKFLVYSNRGNAQFTIPS